MKDHIKKMEDVVAKSRATEDSTEKELLRREFFLLAIDAFNENIAGPITLADGRVLNTPEIEL